MKTSFLKKILLLIVIPLSLFSEVLNKNIDEYLDEQIKIANKVIKNIKENKYVDLYDEKSYDKEINYLLSRIEINQRYDNKYAVKRDEIKLLILQEKRLYETTLRDIVEAKNTFKDKAYFIELLESAIKTLEQNTIKEFSTYYQEEKDKKTKVATEFVQNYERLDQQNSQQLFTLKHLLGNLHLYREDTFLIDYFNLDYFINSIDMNKTIYPISQFTSYNFKFSIGELAVVIFIMLIFRRLNTKTLSLLTRVISLFYKKKDQDTQETITEFIETSINKPLIFTLYLLSIHISLVILIKDEELLLSIIPWINTLYMGILTWAIYSILDNSIQNYAEHMIEKYPNLRREMIVFILRITKIILILFVILFLFTQLGIDIKAIAASLGVGGIAIALASKDTLTNFFGSLSIMTDNSFSQGDWIIANDVEGTVVDIRMRTTRVRTFDNAMITIPNSELANTHIKNYSKRKIGRRIKMKIGITYESSMQDIVNLKNDIYEMLNDHPQIATDKNSSLTSSRKFEATKREDLHGVKRTLLVFIDEYDSSSINILIYSFSRTTDWQEWLEVKEDVLIKIAELVEKNNCEFAYPTQTINLRN